MARDEQRSDALDETRLRHLIEVGTGLVAELDPEVVLGRVLELACELTGARYAALGVLDAERSKLERFITHGIEPSVREAIGELPSGHGVLGLLIDDPRPLRLTNVGEHPRSYGFPPGHPPMTNFLGVPILIRGEAWGNLYLTEKDGEFDQGDEQAALILAGWTAIAVENAQLYRRVESQRDELEDAVRRLEAATEVARAVGGETDLDRILQTIVKRGRALVSAHSMLILLRDGDELVIVASAGELEHDLVGTRIPIEGTISGHVLSTRRAENLSNVGNHLRFALAGRIRARSGLFVPLVFRGAALGVMNAFDRRGDEDFNQRDLMSLEGFAASAATAVATAQTVAEDRMRESIAAAERERGRWARELHDESLQSMAGMRVLISTARRSGSAEEVDDLLAQGLEQIDDSIAEMRRLIADLRPATLDELGLATALEALVERIGWGKELEVELDIDLAYESHNHRTRLTGQIEDTVYRLVQEALNNALRHGDVAAARVSVVESVGSVEVQVSDEGRGFDPRAETAGFGLRGMRERLALAQGTLVVRSAPGEGTTVTAVLPARHRGEESKPRLPLVARREGTG